VPAIWQRRSTVWQQVQMRKEIDYGKNIISGMLFRDKW
jgi:hypothetical protein